MIKTKLKREPAPRLGYDEGETSRCDRKGLRISQISRENNVVKPACSLPCRKILRLPSYRQIRLIGNDNRDGRDGIEREKEGKSNRKRIDIKILEYKSNRV